MADETVIACLQHAIEDAQSTIRGYDTKAEILGILLTLAIGITNYEQLTQVAACSKLLLCAAWVSCLIALVALGRVLYPKSDPFQGIGLGTYSPQGIYFLSKVTASAQNTVSALADKALQTDWVSELIYENMKLSVIRDHKHVCFVAALKLAGVALALIAAFLVVTLFSGT